MEKEAVTLLKNLLMQQNRKTVTLDALQEVCRRMDYAPFHDAITSLQQDGVLAPIKAGGCDHGGLARKYTIHLGPLFAASAARIQQEAIADAISGTLDLSWDMSHPYGEWQRDRTAIETLSNYLQQLSCPPAELPKTSLQQRSYDIFGDEKFLLSDGGLLTRLGLSREALGVAPEADPLMMAFHPTDSMLPSPAYENGHICYYHLIVENKAPWMALFPHLAETTLTSLILGYGWKILASIDQLPAQCGYPKAHHIAWYFGDFDWEGLRIWHELAEKCETLDGRIELRLAVPFYAAFLTHPESHGKEQQSPAPEALGAFLRQMPELLRSRSCHLLKSGCYYPQEALGTDELLSCLKETLHGT